MHESRQVAAGDPFRQAETRNWILNVIATGDPLTQISITRTIAAPADLVFRTVADISNFSQAIPDIVDVEFLSEVKSGVGTRFRETRRHGGKEFATELEVTEYVENDRVRIVADSHGTVWDTTFTVENQPDATVLRMVMDARPHNLLSKLTNPIMKGFIQKAIERDMDVVKEYCEAMQ